jgi:transposase
MNAYSSDLRERVIVAARDANLTQPEIAETFSISLSSVEDWLRTYRTTRRLKPRPFTGGAKRALQSQAQVTRTAVKQQPDATLAELCIVVATKTGVSANPSMMCRELQILNVPRKKSFARHTTRNPARSKTASRTSRQDRGDAAITRQTSKIHRSTEAHERR